MIQPGLFYEGTGVPSDQRKQLLWRGISRAIAGRQSGSSARFDRTSFLWGIAASFLLLFACIGFYATLNLIAEQNQPRQLKLERAYQSAIREFELVARTESDSHISNQNIEPRDVRAEQLKQLDSAILRLRSEMRGKDLSPMLQSRLRSLYGLKLQTLQQMIEQGDLEL